MNATESVALMAYQHEVIESIVIVFSSLSLVASATMIGLLLFHPSYKQSTGPHVLAFFSCFVFQSVIVLLSGVGDFKAWTFDHSWCLAQAVGIQFFAVFQIFEMLAIVVILHQVIFAGLFAERSPRREAFFFGLSVCGTLIFTVLPLILQVTSKDSVQFAIFGYETNDTSCWFHRDPLSYYFEWYFGITLTVTVIFSIFLVRVLRVGCTILRSVGLERWHGHVRAYVFRRLVFVVVFWVIVLVMLMMPVLSLALDEITALEKYRIRVVTSLVVNGNGFWFTLVFVLPDSVLLRVRRRGTRKSLASATISAFLSNDGSEDFTGPSINNSTSTSGTPFTDVGNDDNAYFRNVAQHLVQQESGVSLARASSTGSLKLGDMPRTSSGFVKLDSVASLPSPRKGTAAADAGKEEVQGKDGEAPTSSGDQESKRQAPAEGQTSIMV